jgi:hypothetical protein
VRIQEEHEPVEMKFHYRNLIVDLQACRSQASQPPHKKQINKLISRQDTEEESSSEKEVYFLGEVAYWTPSRACDIMDCITKLNETKIEFKIDWR